MRTMDVFYAFPSILLAVAISGAMGGGMINGIISLSLVFTPAMCRVAETATAQVRNLDYIDAPPASGASTLTIIPHHALATAPAPLFTSPSPPLTLTLFPPP